MFTGEVTTRCTSSSKAVPLVEFGHDFSINFLHDFEGIISRTFRRGIFMKFVRKEDIQEDLPSKRWSGGGLMSLIRGTSPSDSSKMSQGGYLQPL